MLAEHWPAVAVALAGLLALPLAWRFGRGWLALGVGLLLFAGGAAVPGSVANWLALGGLGVLVVMAGVLLLSGWWSRWLALVATSTGLVGLGGLLLPGAARLFHDLAEDALTLRLHAPAWL